MRREERRVPLLCAIAARLLAFEKKNATLKKRSVMNTPKAVVCMAGASYHRLWALSATDDSRVQVSTGWRVKMKSR